MLANQRRETIMHVQHKQTPQKARKIHCALDSIASTFRMRVILYRLRTSPQGGRPVED